MEKRALIAVVLSVIILLAFQAWFSRHYQPPKAPPPKSPKAPLLTKPEKEKKPSELAPPETLKKLPPLESLKEFRVDTSLFQALLTEAGARFRSFELKTYRQNLKPDSPYIQLVSAPKEGLPIEIYLASQPETAIYPYRGAQKDLTYDFVWGESPLQITKTFSFSPKNYLFHFAVTLQNKGSKEVRDRLLLRLVSRPFSRANRYVFKGPAYYNGKNLEEVKLKDHLKEYLGPVSWVGYEDAYFLLALIPEEEASYRLTFRRLKDQVDEVILWTPEFSLPPGESRTFSFKAYFGPKKMENLKAAGYHLTKALHFGFFDPVAKPLLWCLKFFHRFVGNYGVAIILLTFLIRVLFWPLNHLSYKSMKRMQELQPVIKKLREKYKDDPQTLNKELMQLYRTYKINPFSGCLPMLIQIPVFFALYKVLLQAIELRHAPFMLWINDLSAPDRLYLGFNLPYLGGLPVLTILMGVSMYLQQKLSPTSLDPTQAKMMLLMPMFFTVLFVNFPSGLVLYWLVNNVLSIVQQLSTSKIHRAR